MRFFFVYGLALWAAGTVALRFFGRSLLNPARPAVLIALFAISFPLMAWLIRRLCLDRKLATSDWARAAIFFALPSLVLDALASVFFPHVSDAARMGRLLRGLDTVVLRGRVCGRSSNALVRR